MPKRTIPERAPIGDLFRGVVLQIDGKQLLAIDPQPGAEIIASGELIIRYGLRFLGKLHQSIVPGLVVLDYGEMLTGEEAWEFLLKHSNLHPRAEVVGYRNNGSEDMVFIKTLDMAVLPEALVYNDKTSTTPLAHPAVLIGPETDGIPPRLLEYLPHYLTLADWLAESST